MCIICVNYHVTTVEACEKHETACLSGECVNSAQICDGVLDCQDGSDEYKCREPLNDREGRERERGGDRERERRE